jgi:hypothetical protein
MVLLPWWFVESTQKTKHIRCSTGTTGFIAALALVFVIPVRHSRCGRIRILGRRQFLLGDHTNKATGWTCNYR